MAQPPLIRASYAKTVIGGIKRRTPDEQHLLLEAIGTELRGEIRNFGMLDWMNASRFAQLVTAVHHTLGPRRAEDFWRANLLLSLDRTLLKPLRLGAIAVYGNRPGALLKMTPQAWELVSKHAGSCRTVEFSSAIELHFAELPQELRIPGMLALWAGGSQSCIQLMGFDGKVHAEFARAGNAIVVAEWASQ